LPYEAETPAWIAGGRRWIEPPICVLALCDRVHRLTDDGWRPARGCAPTGPSISLLLSFELTKQPDKLRRQRRVGDINCRGTKRVADRVEDDVVDVFGVVG
jgi:hypothetical protein